MSQDIADRIAGVRDKWHTKKHPFFELMLDGSLDLRAVGAYMASHYKFVEMALPSFGFLLWKGPQDVKHAVIENLAEEEGLIAIPRPGHEAHDHTRMILDFCNAAGFSDDEVKDFDIGPAWHARRLQYVHTLREESLGAILAMQATQEGQQPGLNNEIIIPSLVDRYGFARDSKDIAFFVEHAEADVEHSDRQMALCEKYIDSPSAAERAIEVCEDACMLRWEGITELYRTYVLQEDRLLPPGMTK